ncbi:hypothetical protein [Streptomyces sp. RKAG337]|uniref:hypothetical protein n=1 Tax=Streptomyces sp. RKAG337 TaxID=2893404 RepID=UPI0020337112|nr:hypothetical protein [Streptomyces sp. RKAG337]MCM2430985.1 hypothetical protein [Streptomyces sp. RKAG337]
MSRAPVTHSSTPDIVELVGISAHFTPLEVEGLVRTAVDALFGDWADLSERQHELVERAHTLMQQEGEDDSPEEANDADVPSTGTAYARVRAARERLNEDAAAAAAEFTALLRRLFPNAAHIVLNFRSGDSIALERAITAEGTTVRTFDDLSARLPALPDDLIHAWWPHDLTREITLDHIAEELREAGVVFDSLPEEVRDLDQDDRYAYLPSIDLEEER